MKYQEEIGDFPTLGDAGLASPLLLVALTVQSECHLPW